MSNSKKRKSNKKEINQKNFSFNKIIEEMLAKAAILQIQFKATQLANVPAEFKIAELPAVKLIFEERIAGVLSMPKKCLPLADEQKGFLRLERLSSNDKIFLAMRDVEMDELDAEEDLICDAKKDLGTIGLASCLSIGIHSGQYKGIIHWSSNFIEGFEELFAAMKEKYKLLNEVGHVILVGANRDLQVMKGCLELLSYLHRKYHIFPTAALCLSMGDDMSRVIMQQSGVIGYAIGTGGLTLTNEDFDRDRGWVPEKKPLKLNSPMAALFKAQSKSKLEVFCFR